MKRVGLDKKAGLITGRLVPSRRAIKEPGAFFTFLSNNLVEREEREGRPKRPPDEKRRVFLACYLTGER